MTYGHIVREAKLETARMDIEIWTSSVFAIARIEQAFAECRRQSNGPYAPNAATYAARYLNMCEVVGAWG